MRNWKAGYHRLSGYDFNTFCWFVVLCALCFLWAMFSMGCASQEGALANEGDELQLLIPNDLVKADITDYLMWSEGIEFAFCLYGTVEHLTVIVTDIRFPPQRGTTTTVRYDIDNCRTRPNLLGVGHLHPDGNRGLSEVDVKTFEENPEHFAFLLTLEGDMLVLEVFGKKDILTARR